MSERANILVVDDRPENLLTLQASLEKLGERVVTAASGEEALRRLLERDFAVVILDVQMPGMDGYETATLIRSRERLRYTPIIFLTAIFATEPQIFKGYESGAVDFLVKPIAPEILRSKVASFVELYKKTEEVKRQAERLREIEKQAKEREADRAETLERLVGERTEELGRANRDLETMLYIAAHDLKEPLNAIQNFSRVVLERHAAPLDEKGQDYLGRIDRAAHRMRKLLDDLMVLAQARKIDPPTTEIPAHEVVHEAIGRFAERIRENGAQVVVEERLPPIRAHRTWAVEILANLLSNALKFTRPGVPAEIEIGGYEGPEGTGLVVRDRGPGVPKELEERVFQLFQRGVGREVEGTGAGLSIVRHVAERHGGGAWLRPREGGGTEAVVTFGRARAAGRTANLLVVDDDEDFLFILRESLSASSEIGRIETARDGEDAVGRLRKTNGGAYRPDLVLLDINMPRKNGFEVLAEMKADPKLRGIPVIMVTSSARWEDRERSLRDGARSFISKPFEMEELLLAIGQVIHG